MDIERQNPAAPAIPQSPQHPHSPAAPPPLLDVTAPPAPPFSIRDWLLPAAMLAIFGAGFLAVRFLGGSRFIMIATLAVLAITGIVVLILSQGRRERFIHGLFSTDADDPAFYSKLAERLGLEALDLQLVAGTLARRGRPVAVRIHSGDAPPIEPFTVEFEPQRLNEADAGFRALALRPDEINEADERSPVRRTVSRAWRVGAMGFSLYALAHVIYYAVEAWQSQWLNPKLLSWLICLGVSMLIPFLHFTPLPRPVIVPGGLVMRRPHWVAGKFGIKLYRPTDGALIVYQVSRLKWAWVLGTRGGVETGTITEIEARTLLRAWLSPLSPPPLERVRRLFGGEG